MGPLRTYKGEPFRESHLRCLSGSFANAFLASIEKYRHRTLAVTYDAENQAVSKTFGEFAADVERARGYIREHRENAEVAATLGGNAYLHLVFTVAILLDGLILCPLAPGDSRARLAQKLESVGAETVVFGEAGLAALIPSERRYFPMESFREAAVEAGPPRSRPPESPFILIFTSGSTGYSKIVEQMEGNVLANVDALIERHSLKPQEVIGTSMPIHHVNALEFSFFCCLFSGAKLVLLKKFRTDAVLRAIADERVTILSLFPQLLSQMLQRKDEILRADHSSLKYVVSAAAPLAPKLAREFDETFPFRLVQGYGLSEAVNFSALMPTNLSRDEHRHWLSDFERPSIGTPLRGNDLFILDERGCEAGPGEKGEICIRGHNVTRGYRGDRERKIFAGDYLHTGDLGFYLPGHDRENFFFVTGRLKDVAKRFGKTISLVEIDDILIELMPVKAIAVPFENDVAGEEIAVVIQIAGEQEVTSDSLKRIFRDRLPDEEHPKVALLTSEPVRTASGKACRWQFTGRFNEFRGKIFGSGILLVDDR